MTAKLCSMNVCFLMNNIQIVLALKHGNIILTVLFVIHSILSGLRLLLHRIDRSFLGQKSSSFPQVALCEYQPFWFLMSQTFVCYYQTFALTK